jgi:ATP-dependent RNA helicase DeaD
MEQRQRDRVMQMFRGGKADLLIATDVAARGLDIEHLSHVFNYDVPPAAEAYVHRIGRTGRAGREGTAITLAEPREHRMLRAIESFTKQKIDILTVPTVAELRSKRLDVTKASIRELILAGELDDVRVVVDTLAREFDIVAIASAAVKLAHQSQAGDEAERDIPVVVPHERPAPRGFRPDRETRAPRDSRETREPRTPQRFSKGAVVGPASPRDKRRDRPEPTEEVAMLFVGAGREAGIRPGDLVGAITGEAGINSRELGAIQIADRFSLVEVPASRADEIIAALKATTIRGRKVPVRRDRDGSR